MALAKPSWFTGPVIVLTFLPSCEKSILFSRADDPSVGLSEGTARQDGSRFRIKGERTSKWYFSRRVGETRSGYNALVEEDTDRILGGHILGGGAKEVINLFALAIRLEIPARDLKHTLSAYPSHSSDVAYML